MTNIIERLFYQFFDNMKASPSLDWPEIPNDPKDSDQIDEPTDVMTH